MRGFKKSTPSKTFTTHASKPLPFIDVRGCVAQDNGGDGIGGMGGGWTLAGNRAANNDGNGILVSGREVVDGGGNSGTGNRGLHQQRPAAQCEISGAPCRP